MPEHHGDGGLASTLLGQKPPRAGSGDTGVYEGFPPRTSHGPQGKGPPAIIKAGQLRPVHPAIETCSPCFLSDAPLQHTVRPETRPA
jgi:hypothetical protein